MASTLTLKCIYSMCLHTIIPWQALKNAWVHFKGPDFIVLGCDLRIRVFKDSLGDADMS